MSRTTPTRSSQAVSDMDSEGVEPQLQGSLQQGIRLA